jgi:flagellar protein FlaI
MAEEQENILTEYDLDVHGTPVHIKIYVASDFVPIYEVTFPGIGSATKFLLLSLRSELVTMVPIDPLRIETKAYMEELNKKYIEASSILIDKYLPNPSAETKKLLTSYIINIMLGLGDLEVPLSDEGLEEVAVNNSITPIWVFHRQFGWCKTTITMQSEELIYENAEQIGRRVGREINNLAPLMDAELADGSRVNATLFPISQFGNTITIRKFTKNPWTMPALIKNKTVSVEIAALIWLCIQNELSMLISGGTASGKTSFLNAMSVFFPATRRIITVEETRELMLPVSLQWVSMVTRQPNPEGKGEVTMYNLMVNALRQRPDIMIVGEVRTEKDAETLFEAIHTGHAVYGTVHADNAQDTIIRMSNPPINLPKLMLNSISGITVLFRHRSKGIRRVLEFGEVLTTGDVNVLHRWDVYSDSFSQIGDMTRLGEMLSLYAGLTKKEIDQDIAEKVKILNYMVNNDVIGIDDAGFVVATYYKNRAKVVEVAESNIKFSRDLF